VSPSQPDSLRFVAISDTHGHRPSVPEGDVLLHAGDFSRLGTLGEVESFCCWFGSLPHRRKILIAGNHDLSLHGATYEQTSARFGSFLTADQAAEASAQARKLVASIPNCDYLMDSGTTVEGIRIWGSPWQPEFFDWAFNLPRGEPCRQKWRLIPSGTHVVITHGPPLGHGDLCQSGQRAGCLDLLDELQTRVQPLYHVFGHIHEGRGVTTDGTTKYVNASTCTLRYRPDNPAMVFDVPLAAAAGDTGA